MPRKSLGQNFLYDQAILKQLIQCAEISQEDIVVEIGPGPGTLTKMLAQKSKKVIAIELDAMLFKKLKTDFSETKNIELVQGDVLKFPFGSIGNFKVVANIPYYITTPIIFKLLEARDCLKTMTLTIQKEVAERIVAKPGKKDYGVLSIMVQYYARPELKFIISRKSFRPAPRVDSAVVHFTILERPSVQVKDEKLFFKVVRTAFSKRRKTLSNSLKSLAENIKDILIVCGIDPKRRPETLSLDDFTRLSDLLGK